MAAAAEMERVQIAARTSVAMTHASNRGRDVGGHVAYGWRLTADGKSPEQAPQEQAAIERMTARRASGESYRAIAAELNEAVIDSRKGTPWKPRSVKAVLDRVVYAQPAGYHRP